MMVEDGHPTAEIEQCEHDGCLGAQVGAGRCIEHIDVPGLQKAVEAWRLGEPIDARKTKISSLCLQKLLHALADVEVEPRPERPTRLRPSSCGALHFESATFVGSADFTGLTFPGPVYFDGAAFQGEADFTGTTFGEHADFDHVTFSGPARFEQAIFDDHAGFEAARFEDSAMFSAAKFRSYVDLQDATFSRDAQMTGATLQLARQLGPFRVAEELIFDECVFSERVIVEATARVLHARAAVFADGVRLSVEEAAVDLQRADFGRASTLSGRGKTGPRLTTLRGAQVAALAISGVDIRSCRFFGAHGLESLNIEPSCTWLQSPDHKGCIDREVIAEERDWRLAEEQRRGNHGIRRCMPRPWSKQNPNPLDRSDQSEPLYPDQLAALYRAMRKAREDNRDQAGAGDLYYGEMEMRRLTPITRGRGWWRGCCDKFVIGTYWLLAGYGLRASRALAALLAVILLMAIPLTHWGIHNEHNYGRSVLFALQSSVSLLHPPSAHLSASGEVIEVLVRIAGPLFFGLAILSLRSRIKR